MFYTKKPKTNTPVLIPVKKPRNPIVLPPNKRHEDKRKKDKYLNKDHQLDQE